MMAANYAHALTLIDRLDIVRNWLSNVGRPYPPIEEVRALAFLRLMGDRTITAYIVDDGVEQRVLANPMDRMVNAINKTFEAWGDFVRSMDHQLRGSEHV